MVNGKSGRDILLGGNGETATAGDDVRTEVIDNEFTFTAEWLNAA